MGNLGKCFALLLLLMMIASSIIMVKPVFASLSTPEFTVQYVDHSYYTQPTTTIDPYSGQIIVPRYYVVNKTLDVTIKNQPFTPYTVDGNVTKLYYVIYYKGHFEDTWGDYEQIEGSNSDYTVISFPFYIGNLDKQVDFKMQAVVGCYFYAYGPQEHLFQEKGLYFMPVDESVWSNVQTGTIPAAGNVLSTQTTNPLTPSPAPTETPTITPSPTPANPNLSLNQQSLAAVGIGVAGVVVVAAFLIFRRSKLAEKTTSKEPPPPPNP
jgi:hypothetical protein